MPSPNVDPSPYVGNDEIRIVEERVLAHDWYLLRKTIASVGAAIQDCVNG